MTLAELLTEASLRTRFKNKIAKSHAVGSDGISTESFTEHLDSEIALIQRKVANFSYRFSRFKEILILKGKHSNPRAVYIPTVRDRLLLNVLKSYLNHHFRDELSPHQASVQQNIREIKATIDSDAYDVFLKLDVEQFFPSLDHEILLEKLKDKVSEPEVISLLKKVLNRSEKGIAQGLSIASVLASIYLIEIDDEFKNNPNFRYFRFVDDILILCKASDVKQIELDIQQRMQALKLKLHKKEVNGKSEIGQLKQDELQYLGFLFHGDKISVRDSSVERLRNRLLNLVGQFKKEHPNYKKADLVEFYRALNLKITGCLYRDRQYGWLFFFNQINDLTLLHQLDLFVEKILTQAGIPQKKPKVKSFVKTYYEICSLKPERLDAKSYIPSFYSKHRTVESVFDNLELYEEDDQIEEELMSLEEILEIMEESDTPTQTISELEAMIIELEDDVIFY